ncbi:hypothetical protein G6F65_021903 [Rhizopus arrhizus]|nr:hypothetical protein G6F65_021903 [Rhizopus arrhizus]
MKLRRRGSAAGPAEGSGCGTEQQGLRHGIRSRRTGKTGRNQGVVGPLRDAGCHAVCRRRAVLGRVVGLEGLRIAPCQSGHGLLRSAGRRGPPRWRRFRRAHQDRCRHAARPIPGYRLRRPRRAGCGAGPAGSEGRGRCP